MVENSFCYQFVVDFITPDATTIIKKKRQINIPWQYFPVWSKVAGIPDDQNLRHQGSMSRQRYHKNNASMIIKHSCRVQALL